jgi:FkbM family methyltransferase
MAAMRESLADLLRPDRMTSVVDIGANPIDGDPPYKPMLRQRLCRLIGFEPQPEALAELNSKKSDLETYLPYAVSDGKERILRVCQAPGMTSFLEPDQNALGHFPMFSEWGRVVRELAVVTRRLDDIEEIGAVDFLKIDVQGSELLVFQNGKRQLAKTVAVQVEVSFITIYKGQPVFGEIDVELRKLGLVPHAFAAINRRMIAPMMGNSVYAAINQVLEADVVYVRDFTRPDAMDVEQMKHLAIIAHHCYRSYDLAMNCIYHLAKKGAVRQGVVNQYLNLVQSEALSPT